MNHKSNIKQAQSGFSLVELMIALAIGVVLIGGAVYVFANTRAAFQTNENFTLMQENARFAFSMMEPDIQLAGFWGRHNDHEFIRGSAIERGVANPIIVGNDCGPNWILQFDQPLVGFNDIIPTWGCMPARYSPNTDTLAVRRVHINPVPLASLEAGKLYLRSSEAPLSEVFEGVAQPSGLPITAQNFEITGRAYYVSPYSASNANDSSDNDGVPSLRRVQLEAVGITPTMVDREVTRGVENMHVQYGIDLTPTAAGRKAINAYVTADNPLLAQPGVEVRSVRIWLLMRAERVETGYTDDQTYQLGDVSVGPTNDRFRRLVVSRTIFLRNQHQ